MEEYLGFKYRIEDSGLAIMTEEPGIFWDERTLKEVVLQNRYKPIKTLKWLKEQTGLAWIYNNEYKVLSVKGVQDGEVYDFKDNTAFLWLNGDIIVNPYNEDGTWCDMTPQEFIEKIARGEWI